MKSIASTFIGTIAILGLAGIAHGQTWPQRTVKIVVPFAAGGPSDSMARLTAERLGPALGQPVIVENLPGAGGAIAGEAVVRAQDDGHVLYWVTPSQITILPEISKLTYDPVRQLQPITIVAENKFVLVVNPKALSVATISEFVDRARSDPGKLSYAHAGRGSIVHLSMELFARRSNLQLVGVPYKGIAPALTDVIAGHVPAMFVGLADAIQHRNSGTLRLLAVSTEKRISEIPDIPTVGESGMRGFHIVSWNGLMAPLGTPRAVVERIASEVARATKTPAFAERVIGLGFDPVGCTPEEFTARISTEIPMWMEAVRSAGIRPD